MKLLCKSLLAPLALLALGAEAQSVTVLSGGGDARACSSAAELSEHLRPSRSDVDPCDRALDSVGLTRRDRAATFINRGILLTKLERYQDALNDYNESIKVQELPQAWNGKGNLYYLAERYDDAIAAYERSLELDLPRPHVAHYNMGLVHERRGDPAAARRSYEKALELMPDWQPAVDRLQEMQQ